MNPQLPEDVIGRILQIGDPKTGRLVSKRSRDTVDLARTHLVVRGLGLDGRPQAVTARFPNLTHITIIVTVCECDDAFVVRHEAITWEEYTENVWRGLRAWADTVASLRHLRHVHLTAIDAVSCLTPSRDQELAEVFFSRDRADSTITNAPRHCLSAPFPFHDGCIHMPTDVFWRIVEANGYQRPLMNTYRCKGMRKHDQRFGGNYYPCHADRAA